MEGLLLNDENDCGRIVRLWGVCVCASPFMYTNPRHRSSQN